MKKLLVSCDEFVYSFNGQFFFREFGNILIYRYLSVFDNLRLIVRIKFVSSESELGIYNIPLADSRIEIYPIPFFRGPKQYAIKYFEVKKILSKSVDGCDVALFRVPSTIGFAVLREVRKQGMPYAVEVVANPKEFASNLRNIIFRRLMYIMHWQQLSACKHADCASYVTEYSLQKIYPATKCEHFESYYSTVQLNDSFFSGARQYPKQKSFILCHVANPINNYTKGHIILIDIVKLLIDRGYDVVAQFAGDGEFVHIFEKYAEQLGILNKINFVGLLKQHALKDFLDNSDMMVFPTKTEGLPRVIIEAMATGLPCLSTPVGGIPELISGEMMFQPNDSVGFANKLMEIIDNPLLYCKLSKAAFEKANEFKADILQTRRVEFYKYLKYISNI